MYNTPVMTVGSVAGIGSVLAPQFVWWFLGGFALFAAGQSLLRTLPRRKA